MLSSERLDVSITVDLSAEGVEGSKRHCGVFMTPGGKRKINRKEAEEKQKGGKRGREDSVRDEGWKTE